MSKKITAEGFKKAFQSKACNFDGFSEKYLQKNFRDDWIVGVVGYNFNVSNGY